MDSRISPCKIDVHKATDLSPELRRAAEALLGQTLEADETVVRRASKGYITKEAAPGKVRLEAFERLFEQMDRIARRVKDTPDEELNAVIDEAVAETRSHGR